MKNRVEIGDGNLKKYNLETLMNIFNGKYLKVSKHKGYEYKFGFSYLKNLYILRYHDKGEKYNLECEMEGKGDTSEVLKYFDFILNFWYHSYIHNKIISFYFSIMEVGPIPCPKHPQ